MARLSDQRKRKSKRSGRAAQSSAGAPPQIIIPDEPGREIEIRAEADPGTRSETVEVAPGALAFVRESAESAHAASRAAIQANDAAWEQAKAARKAIIYAQSALLVSLASADGMVAVLAVQVAVFMR